MNTTEDQKILRLAFGCSKAPKDAPAKILRQVETDSQALAISIRAGGHKVAYIAACIGKSKGYVSLMQTGARPIPDRLVSPLCSATGSNLLRQFRDLQRALDGVCEVSRLAEMLRAA